MDTLQNIPVSVWMIMVGVCGQSIGGFFYVYRKKIFQIHLRQYIGPVLLTAMLHGVGVAALFSALYAGPLAFVLGVAILALSFIPLGVVAGRILGDP